jgi:RimJ/RimL family protein N-acetyltransferase
MELAAGPVVLRPWRKGDEAVLVRHANNRNVSIHLRDRFPYPYTAEHAAHWIGLCEAHEARPLHFAVCVDGEPVGGAGLEPQGDVHRKTAEVGYWLGESVWGRGLATHALRLLTGYAFSAFDFERLQACVYETNPASGRVLEKCGYRLEGRLQRSVFKEGRLLDTFLYARLRSAGPA